MICTAPGEWGKLNAFQRVVLQWSVLHPYNATHTYKIAGPSRPNELRQAVCDTYAVHGLGSVQLDASGRCFRHACDAAPEIEVVDGGSSVDSALCEHLGRQLNRPFERPQCKPFRFSVLDAGPHSHYVTVSYDHWVADSIAARLLLRNVLGRYLHLDVPENEERLELYPDTYRDVFAHRLGGAKVVMAAARSLGQWNRNRSAWQVAYWSNTQWSVQHQLHATTPGTVPRLREFARSLGATVHDVVLAAMGRAMAEIMPSRGKQRELALGSIVDTRGLAHEDLSHAFGAFLGYYQVRSKSDASVGLDEAVRRIAALTQPIKSRQRYLDSVLNMQFVNTVWPWLPESAKAHFMRKAMPLTGGVSNVLVRDGWIDQNRHAILDYYRAAPTGPMLPLVLTPTTLGEGMNIGVTYRVAGFPRAKIDNLMGLFLEQIEHPQRSSRPMLRPKQCGKVSVAPAWPTPTVQATEPAEPTAR